MFVDIGYIAAAKKRMHQINCEDIRNLKFVNNGEEVEFSENQIKSFELSGRNNIDIINQFIPTQVKAK